MLIYCFIIYTKLKDCKDNEIIINYNKLAKEILKLDLIGLNDGIWNLIEKFKTSNFDLSKVGFKEYYTILKHLENMKNNKYFCIKYKIMKGCSTPKCVETSTNYEFFSSTINFNEEYILQYNVFNLIEILFSNINTYCTKCQWKDGTIIKNTAPNFSKLIWKFKLLLFCSLLLKII